MGVDHGSIARKVAKQGLYVT